MKKPEQGNPANLALEWRPTMARNTETAAADTPATTEAPAAVENDNRFIQITVPAGHPSGLEGLQKRVDVIRALAKTGEWTRGDIAKNISELQGTKVPYQIVFQATKTIPNVKKAERAVAEAPAGEGAETAAAE